MIPSNPGNNWKNRLHSHVTGKKILLICTAIFFIFSGGNLFSQSLEFAQVKLVTTQQTVPSNKVWKVESVLSNSDLAPAFAGCGSFTSASTQILINGTASYIQTTSHVHGSGSCSIGQGQSVMSSNVSQLPIWLASGNTLAASTNTAYISVLEFDIVTP